MKRRRLKVKRIVIIGIILIVILLIMLSPFIFVNIKLIGNRKIELDYGEKYSEPGFKAYMFNKEITNKIKVKNDIRPVRKLINLQFQNYKYHKLKTYII